MKAIYQLRLSDDSIVHFEGETGHTCEQLKASARKTLGREVLEVLDEVPKYCFGHVQTESAKYNRALRRKKKLQS